MQVRDLNILNHYLSSLWGSYHVEIWLGIVQLAMARRQCSFPKYFEQVIASDASNEQIANAQPRKNVRYEVFPAERTNLADSSVDLITIAQALHWFDLDDFYKEAKRVLRKDDNGISRGGIGGIIAAWAYGLHSLSAQIDIITHLLYEDILGPYWPQERKIVENRYEGIPFPFQEIETPGFQIELDWNLSELIGYLYTWSSVQKFIEKNNSDPIKQIYDELAAAWGEKQTSHKRRVVWPIYMKAGRS